jgi:mono/diheme cytochrome c family protein
MAADIQGPAASVIEQGRYLVQLANCTSCHTVKGGAGFAGGKAFQTPYAFLGKVYSSNITPDRATGIGSWTESDFVLAMRTGVAPGGKRLFPAFPYPSFTKLTDGDLKAIFAYLRTIPAVSSTPPRNGFWFRQRWALRLWSSWFLRPGVIVGEQRQSPELERGRYLVEALGHCGACHTPRNWLLAERRDAALSGGTQLSEVANDRLRLWSAPNLTAAAGGLAKWSLEDVRKYLKTGNSRRAGLFGPMNEVIANSLRFLSDSDAAAMALYLKSLPANLDSPQQTLADGEMAAGQSLYEKHCEECHLSTGRGGFRKAPPVSGNSVVQTSNPASLINVILYGAAAAPDMPSNPEAWEDMAGFKDKMGDEEIAQLSNFLRASWGNRGSRVLPSAVAAQR